MSVNCTSLGKRISFYRSKSNLSQEALAAKINCSREHIVRIPAVGCVDDVLDGYFQSAYIVPGLHPTVIPIVDRDESNAQQ